ncbi:cutinase-domain-containing protein [Xylariaceae sp. FL1651]|nr:cutinase-domain-containing protein [Xylariaceae sp. FL1651]
MRLITALGFAALAAASPSMLMERNAVDIEAVVRVEKRQTGTVAKEFTQGGCRDNIFIFSRGSAETGNMGAICGPPTSDGLKQALGDAAVATEGVDYGALLSTNFLPGGADPVGIQTMTDLINKAASQCPDSNILVGGYSQGAAMVHRSVESLSAPVQSRIAGIVTFGDTQNVQDNGQINGFDPAKTKVICNDADAVCKGTLVVLPAHLDYTRRTPEAVDFLVAQVQNGKSAGTAGNAGNSTGSGVSNASGASTAAAAAASSGAASLRRNNGVRGLRLGK